MTVKHGLIKYDIIFMISDKLVQSISVIRPPGYRADVTQSQTSHPKI